MAEPALSWNGPGGSIRLEVGPKGGVKWVIVDANGTIRESRKSPTFDVIEKLGLDSNTVLSEYNAWKGASEAVSAASEKLGDLPPLEPLTEVEVQDMVKAIGVLVDADADALGSYLFAETQAQRAALVETYYDSLVSQMTGVASEEILERARALAENAAESLLRTFVEADLNSMGKVIADGIAAGLNPRDIARNLEMVQGLDANRASAFLKYREELENSPDLTDAQIKAREEAEFQRLLRERRETIARTESNYAVSEGDRLEAERLNKKWKVWQTTGDGRVSDACQANEAAGPIGIKENFPGGVATTPQHVNCRCSVTYLSEGADLERARERAGARAERTAAAKEGDGT